MSLAVDLADCRPVNDRGAVDAQETAGVEARLRFLQAILAQKIALGGDDGGVVTLGADAKDLLYG